MRSPASRDSSSSSDSSDFKNRPKFNANECDQFCSGILTTTDSSHQSLFLGPGDCESTSTQSCDADCGGQSWPQSSQNDARSFHNSPNKTSGDLSSSHRPADDTSSKEICTSRTGKKTRENDHSCETQALEGPRVLDTPCEKQVLKNGTRSRRPSKESSDDSDSFTLSHGGSRHSRFLSNYFKNCDGGTFPWNGKLRESALPVRMPPYERGWFNLNAFHTCTTPRGLVPSISGPGPVPLEENMASRIGHFKLSRLWHALEEASCFGVEIPFVDRYGGCSQVVFVPQLSALQLFRLRRGEECSLEKGAEVEYFESRKPHVRPTLFQQIKLLRKGEACRYSNNSLLEADSRLLDAASWMAIYWLPHQRDFNVEVPPPLLVYYSLNGTILPRATSEVSFVGHSNKHLGSTVTQIERIGTLPCREDISIFISDASDCERAAAQCFIDTRQMIQRMLQNNGVQHPDFFHVPSYYFSREY